MVLALVLPNLLDIKLEHLNSAEQHLHRASRSQKAEFPGTLKARVTDFSPYDPHPYSHGRVCICSL